MYYFKPGLDKRTVTDASPAVVLNKKKRLENKILRQAGLPYQKKNGKIEPKKEFHHYVCKCAFHCDVNLKIEKRKQIFNLFWSLGSWDAQSAYLSSLVQEVCYRLNLLNDSDASESK